MEKLKYKNKDLKANITISHSGVCMIKLYDIQGELVDSFYSVKVEEFQDYLMNYFKTCDVVKILKLINSNDNIQN